MIRKLRLKIVGISLVTVAAVLLSALVVLALSTRSQMVHSSEEHLAAALEGNADKNQLPGSSGQPCFVAEVFTGGTIRLSGSSYYNLENQDLVLDIVRSALEEKNDSGVLKEYSLRYMRRVGVVSVRIAFTDCSMERVTMRSLLLRGCLCVIKLLCGGLSKGQAHFAVFQIQRKVCHLALLEPRDDLRIADRRRLLARARHNEPHQHKAQDGQQHKAVDASWFFVQR